MYPVVNLRRLGVGARAYVEGLEDAMVRTAGAYGVCARVRAMDRAHRSLLHECRGSSALYIRELPGCCWHPPWGEGAVV